MLHINAGRPNNETYFQSVNTPKLLYLFISGIYLANKYGRSS